jgi:hypothetical protein
MGGPACTLVLKERMNDEHLRELPKWLEAHGTVTRDPIGFWSISTPVDACGYGPTVNVSLNEDTDRFTDELQAHVQRVLGWPPQQFIHAWGNTRAVEDHMALGRVVVELASRLGAWVHLFEIGPGDQAGEPPSWAEEVQTMTQAELEKMHPEDRDPVDALMKVLGRHGLDAERLFGKIHESVKEDAMKYAAMSPGKVVPFKSSEGGYEYLVDAEFMRAWVADRNFGFA